MTDADHFETAIRDIRGVWPHAPSSWSYSSLRDADLPGADGLAGAKYPGIWDKQGFPQRPLVAALAGDVVHNARTTSARVAFAWLRIYSRGGCRAPSATSVLLHRRGEPDRAGSQTARRKLAPNRCWGGFAERPTERLICGTVQSLVSRGLMAGAHTGASEGAPRPLGPGAILKSPS